MDKENFMGYIDSAGKNYFKLLVIPETIEGINDMISTLIENGWTLIDVGKKALDIIDETPPDKRRTRVPLKLEKWISNLELDKCIFNNISVLFLSEIGRVDPVRLIKYGYSRVHKGILIFPGVISGTKAEYSLEGKPDHMLMDVSEVICIYKNRSE